MSSRKLRRRTVVERHLAGDWVLVDPAGRTVHVLNSTAWSLWQLCDGRRSAQEIIAELARRYDVHELEAREGCLDVIARLQPPPYSRRPMHDHDPAADPCQPGGRCGPGCTGGVRDPGVRVEVISASVGLLHYWSSVYGAFRAQPGPTEIAVHVTSQRDDGPGPGEAFITVAGRTRLWDGFGELFPPLGTPPLDRFIYLHGAAVGRAGQAALLLGGPGKGKTMLTLATLARGAWLLSDGVVPIDPEDLLATPFPKTLRLRREALELLSIDLAHPALMPFRTRSGTIEWWARPDKLLGWRSARVAADVGAIVTLERAGPGAEPMLERLRPREALGQLLGQLYQTPADFQGCMDALVKLCRHAPAYRLAAAAPGLTAKLLDEALLA